MPSTLREKLARQIFHVQPLRDDDDPAFPGIVEPAQDRALEPGDTIFASGFGMCISCLEWIIDNDEGAASASEGAASGSGISVAPTGRGQPVPARPFWINAGLRKDALIPDRFHELARQIPEIPGQLMPIGDADDLLARISAQKPGRVADASDEAL